MGPSRKLTAAVPAILIALVTVPGCGGRNRITPENHLSELTFEKDRALDGLRESLRLHRDAITTLQVEESEKTQVLHDLTGRETALRLALEQVQGLTAEKADLEKSLGESRESERKIREIHERLKDMASSSTEELADLRQKSETALQEKTRLAAENKEIAGQIEVTIRELDDVKAELTRTRAVVRSLQDKSPIDGASPAEAALRLRINELERALAAAEAARSDVEGKVAGSAPAAVAVAAHPAAASRAGVTTWSDLLAYVQGRVDALLQGRFEGDAFDWTIVGVVTVVLLLLFLTAKAFFRGRRLRREIKELRAYGAVPDDELERAVDAAAANSVEEREAPAPAGTSQSSTSRAAPKAAEESVERPMSRRSVYIPREGRDFSAVISSNKVRKAQTPAPATTPAPANQEEAPKAVAGEADGEKREPVPTADGEAKSRRPGGAAERKVIGLSLDRGDLPSRSRKPGADLETGAKKDDPIDEEDSGPAEEMAGTQIISAKDLPKPAPGSEDPEGGDKELLNELRSIINKKFDELMKE